MTRIKKEYVENGDVTLYQERYGEGTESLYCVHGGPGLGLEPFKPTCTELADICQLVLYDQRGCGKSSRLDAEQICPFSLHISDLDRLIEQNGSKAIHLLGHSFGAYFATLFTLERPELVKSLTLITPVSPYRETGRMLHRWHSHLDSKRRAELVGLNYSDDDLEVLANKRLRVVLPLYFEQQHAHEEFIERDLKVSGQMIEYCAKYQKIMDLRERLPEITAPTLIVCGVNDKRTPPSYGREYHERIPDSKFVEISKCGHFPFMEQPEEFISVIRQHLPVNEAQGK